MTHVYILSDHDEYGADNVQATVDREKIAGLIEARASDFKRRDLDYAQQRLIALLERSDEELVKQQKHALMDGWGGLQLHVVRLT